MLKIKNTAVFIRLYGCLGKHKCSEINNKLDFVPLEIVVYRDDENYYVKVLFKTLTSIK